MAIPQKVGLVILVVIIVLVVSFAINSVTFGRKVANEVKELFGKMKEIRPEVVAEEDLEGLPEPVQRYLRYAQIIGKGKVRFVRPKQKGFIRTKEDGGWMPFITIADATGDEMDQGNLVRYLNEMMWFPTAYLNDYVQWESIDSSLPRATISVEGFSASAVLYFNEKGQMTNFVAERYMTVDDESSLRMFSSLRGNCKHLFIDNTALGQRGIGHSRSRSNLPELTLLKNTENLWY